LIDIISFSIAGLDDRNDALRKGTRLQTVLDTIRILHREKENQDLTRPAIHISYLLLRSGLRDLAKLPDILIGLGIDQVVISTLDFVPTREFEDETLCAGNSAEYEKLSSFLDGVKAMSECRGLHVHYNLGQLDKPRKVCSENPQRSFYVSSDGMISPCVFTNLPMANASYRFRGEQLPHEPLVFGNICNYSVSAIWQLKEYRKFRRSFDTGQPRPACRNCHKLYVA
jgi:MoaA/NifB/PqqE/SkfB family radical SAM enzyme